MRPPEIDVLTLKLNAMNPVSHHDITRNDSHVIDRTLISRRLISCMLAPPDRKRCYHTSPIAGLPDMTALYSCPCEKRLLEVVWSLLKEKQKSSLKRCGQKKGSRPWELSLMLSMTGSLERSSITRMSNSIIFPFSFFLRASFVTPHASRWLTDLRVFWSLNGVSEMFKSHLMTSAFLNCSVRQATSLRSQTFQMQSAEQISLLPVISPIRER